MIYVKDVESIVKNLVGHNREEYSRVSILNKLKNSCTYKQKGRSLIFNENEVWNKYFMENERLRILIEKRKITSVEELMLYIEDDDFDY
ncbi:hypothetical protein [Clostridium aciditolerans]|uniref:Uncharacterized protein n=1 Tax=Clostridium aciditolerans TaxID=339861 RepID=A0A934HWQ1_9CLOT|nr:hypothetical protein [Clostridium aciditolerans]MBI6872362.1 hypothetical protein [Clostridium aciditolerans]MTK11161.1 hypothetical protein [Clostridiaceae bacterium]